MSENMVRTQVYLPRGIYNDLQARAKKQGITMAVQIREALENYARRGKHDEKEIEPLDLGNLFEIIGRHGSSGIHDGAENHDKYIYGDPHGENTPARERRRNQEKIVAVREPLANYRLRAKKRTPAKRKGGQR
ncbi:MAG: hypothetical protein HZB17_12905 [Chloroflexi bacterium]|nr:hypothetical protein [Chloroflexota bacterium]